MNFHPPRRFAACLACSFLGGCIAGPPIQKQQDIAVSAECSRAYTLRAPDRLDVSFGSRPNLTASYAIDAEGRIDLGSAGRVRLEGRTVDECTRLIADALGVPRSSVQVRVAEFQSRQIYLFGQVVGRQRSIPYRGPETVSDVLRRAGGLSEGAAGDHVYIVRPRVAEGQRPEIYHVDIRAITEKHDERTNIIIEPFDQIYVGETSRSVVARCLSPCLRPFYELFASFFQSADRPVPPASQGKPQSVS
jgi:protein involved in polysaccharide export with SLBB domain